MAISAEFLDELKARIDLVGLVSRRVRLARRGREHLGLCPFHQEKTPSFTVNEQKGFYHCFGCGAHGSAIDFMMQAEGLEFRDAVAALAGTVGLELPAETPEQRQIEERRRTLHDVNEAAVAYFQAALQGREGRAALDYVRARGLDDALIGRFRLGFAAESGGLKAALLRGGFGEDLMVEAGLLIRPEQPERAAYERFRGRLMFPIADGRGRIVGFGGRSLGDAQPKYLNTPETAAFHKGSLLYGLSQAAAAVRRAGTVVVVEGYMDVIGLARAGFDNVVAPLGTALTEDQLRLLWKFAPEPILCFDPDRAGREAAKRAAVRSLPLIRAGFGLKFAFLSTDTGDDPDAVVRRYPKRTLDRTLTGALPLSDILFSMETDGSLMEIGTRTTLGAADRAKIEASLQRRVQSISDASIRSYFMRDFRQRLWQSRPRPPRPTSRQPEYTAQLPLVVTGRRPAPRRSVTAAERTLIALLLNHPAFFTHAEEELGSVAFADGELERVRQALFDILSADHDLDADGLAAALRAGGLVEPLSDLLADPLLRGNRAIGREAGPDVRDAAWRENLAVVRIAAERAALSSADEGPGAESDEAMARRRLLMQANLERREDEERS